jgi:hypothetical protein
VAAVENPPANATPASAWKRAEPELHTLPSGNVAVLERPSLMNLMSAGEVPKAMVDVAMQAVQGELPDEPAQLAGFLNLMVSAAFVEPRVVCDGEPAEGELHVSALSDADRNYVLRFLQWRVSVVADEAAQEAA